MKIVATKHPTYGYRPEYTFCCEEMEKAIGTYIHFGSISGYDFEDTEVNIHTIHCYPEGAVVNEMAIRYCPFCGQKIEVTLA